MLVRENVQQSFAYRAVGGDDDTMAWRQVEVVDPPKVDSIQVTSTPPAYSGLPSRELRSEDRVLQGATIAVTALTPEQLAGAAFEVTMADQTQTTELSISPAQTPGQYQLELPEGWRAELPAGESLPASYRLRLENPGGLVGFSKPGVLRIEVDSPPSVEWLEPASEVLVTSKAIVPIRVLMEDNLAIAQAELLWMRAEDGEPAESEKEEGEAKSEEAKPTPIILYEGPETPPARTQPPWGAPADSREVAYDLDLAELEP